MISVVETFDSDADEVDIGSRNTGDGQVLFRVFILLSTHILSYIADAQQGYDEYEEETETYAEYYGGGEEDSEDFKFIMTSESLVSIE